MSDKLLIIGISGVTCGGKTTLASQLNQILPKSKIFSQDDYFLNVDDSRHTWIPNLNHINFDILSSLDMDKMYADIMKLTQGKTIIKTVNKRKVFFQEDTNNLRGFLYDKINKSNVDILIVEGFSVFNYRPFLPLFSLKYYFTLSQEECHRRRLTRIYDPPDCDGYFEECVWPEHLKQLKDVKDNVRDLKYFDGLREDSLEEVLLDIANML